MSKKNLRLFINIKQNCIEKLLLKIKSKCYLKSSQIKLSKIVKKKVKQNSI